MPTKPPPLVFDPKERRERSIHARVDVDARVVRFDLERVHLRGQSYFAWDEGCLRVKPPPDPWAWGVEIDFAGLLRDDDQFIVVELDHLSDNCVLGLLKKDRNNFATRFELSDCKDRLEVWISIPEVRDVGSLTIQNGTSILSEADIKRVWIARIASKPINQEIMLSRSREFALPPTVFSPKEHRQRSIHGREDLEARVIFFEPGRVYFQGQSCFVTEKQARYIELKPPADPWAYGVEVDVADLLGADDEFLVAELNYTADPCYVGLLDSRRHFIARLRIPPCNGDLEAWLPIPKRAKLMSIIFQNGEDPLRKATVKRIWLARTTKDRVEPQARLLRAREFVQTKLREETQRKNRKIAVAHQRIQALDEEINNIHEEQLRQHYLAVTPHPALQQGKPVEHLANRRNVEFARVHLGESRILLRGTSRLTEGLRNLRIQVFPNETPWSYGAAIRIGDLLTAADRYVVVNLIKLRKSVGVGILDKNWKEFVLRTSTPSDKQEAELWLPLENPLNVSALVIQNWTTPVSDFFTVEWVKIVRCNGERDDTRASVRLFQFSAKS